MYLNKVLLEISAQLKNKNIDKVWALYIDGLLRLYLHNLFKFQDKIINDPLLQQFSDLKLDKYFNYITKQFRLSTVEDIIASGMFSKKRTLFKQGDDFLLSFLYIQNIFIYFLIYMYFKFKNLLPPDKFNMTDFLNMLKKGEFHKISIGELLSPSISDIKKGNVNGYLKLLDTSDRELYYVWGYEAMVYLSREYLDKKYKIPASWCVGAWKSEHNNADKLFYDDPLYGKGQYWVLIDKTIPEAFIWNEYFTGKKTEYEDPVTHLRFRDIAFHTNDIIEDTEDIKKWIKKYIYPLYEKYTIHWHPYIPPDKKNLHRYKDIEQILLNNFKKYTLPKNLTQLLDFYEQEPPLLKLLIIGFLSDMLFKISDTLYTALEELIASTNKENLKQDIIQFVKSIGFISGDSIVEILLFLFSYYEVPDVIEILIKIKQQNKVVLNKEISAYIKDLYYILIYKYTQQLLQSSKASQITLLYKLLVNVGEKIQNIKKTDSSEIFAEVLEGIEGLASDFDNIPVDKTVIGLLFYYDRDELYLEEEEEKKALEKMVSEFNLLENE